MKPSNFFIGSQEWELQFINSDEILKLAEMKSTEDEKVVLLGLTSAFESKIYLNSDYPLKMSLTLSHELMHACIATYQLSRSIDTTKKCYCEEDICNFMEICGDEYTRLFTELRKVVRHAVKKAKHSRK